MEAVEVAVPVAVVAVPVVAVVVDDLKVYKIEGLPY